MWTIYLLKNFHAWDLHVFADFVVISNLNVLNELQPSGHFYCTELCFWLLLVFCDPEGRLGISDVSPLSEISGLSFDSTLISPNLFFYLVLSYLFLPAGPVVWTFSKKLLNIFFIKR